MIPDLNENGSSPATEVTDESRSCSPMALAFSTVTDPVLSARVRKSHDNLNRNMDWWCSHFSTVPSEMNGRFVAIAGQELFVADTRREVEQLAHEAHPEDDGVFILHLTTPVFPRRYGINRQLGAVSGRPSNTNDRSTPSGN